MADTVDPEEWDASISLGGVLEKLKALIELCLGLFIALIAVQDTNNTDFSAVGAIFVKITLLLDFNYTL